MFRIMNCRFGFQYFKDTVGADRGTGNHDEDHGNDHEGHQHMDRILQEGHHIADLHGSKIDLLTADPDDEHGNEAHQECHGRHDRSHRAVDEDIDTGDVAVDIVKALLFHLLVIEGTDDEHTGQLFTDDKIQPVNELLNDTELRQGDPEGDCHQCDDDQKHPAENAGHAGIAHDLEEGSQSHERRKQHDPQQHIDHHLDLLDVVGGPGDQRCGREPAEFFTGEGFNPLEDIGTHVAAGAGCGAGRKIGGADCTETSEQCDHQHDQAFLQDVPILHGLNIYAEGGIFVPHAHHDCGIQVVLGIPGKLRIDLFENRSGCLR